MSLLTQKIPAKMPAGEYPVKLVNYQEMRKEDGKKGPISYIQLSLQFADRTIPYNFFEGNLRYLGSSLRNQLGRDDEMDLQEILEAAKAAPSLFAVVSYNDYGMNLAFHKSTAETNEEVTA